MPIEIILNSSCVEPTQNRENTVNNYANTNVLTNTVTQNNNSNIKNFFTTSYNMLKNESKECYNMLKNESKELFSLFCIKSGIVCTAIYFALKQIFYLIVCTTSPSSLYINYYAGLAIVMGFFHIAGEIMFYLGCIKYLKNKLFGTTNRTIIVQ